MTVLSVFQRRPLHPGTRAWESAGSTLAAIVRRLADSPLDSTVLQAVGGASASGSAGAARRGGGPSATWRPVVAPDGTRRLEARWDSDH
ncbi:hypothetical protein [Streptomyces sp. NRRL S-495]|uniref:hypothetical protein n=1 Tax=Streptomyces sp. NRRL S-495 TaxID=1609133 RepID=UPI000A58C3E0|nr:hypothetical protein [Streptomyces sp. NRRL S-495]